MPSHIVKSPFKDVALSHDSVYDHIFSNPNRVPDDKVVLIDAMTSRRLTYGQLQSQARKLAAGLSDKLHLQKGDVVGIFSLNSIDYPVLIYGAQCAGLRVTLANAAYTPSELAHQLRDSGAKALFVHPALEKVAREAGKEVGLEGERILGALSRGESGSGLTSFEELCGEREAEPAHFTKEEVMKETAYLCYSSGTTGRSKGVETTHFNITSNILQGSSAFTDLWKPDNVYAGVLPFSHIYGLTCLVHLVVYLGATMVVLPRFDMAVFLRSVRQFQITVAHLVPPILIGLAKTDSIKREMLEPLQYIMSGAAPLSKSLEEGMNSKFACLTAQGYGMTESSPVSHLCPFDNIKPGSIGPCLPNMSCRVVDPESGKDLEKYKDGELWMKGPNIMKGYWNNKEATESTLTRDGWLKTGDIGHYDEDGYFYIVDRLKELIKYKGFQVPPADLEGLLLENPIVSDCCVVGAFDEAEATELPRAYITVTQETLDAQGPESAIEKAVADWVAGKVANHKKLRGGVKIIAEIPKSPAGKLLRRQLRDRAKEEVAAMPKAAKL